MAEVVAKAIEMASPLLEQRQHTARRSTSRASGLAVEADAMRLAQVVANLLTNAAKYTEPQRRPSPSARRWRAGQVVLRVRDNGIGIAPEMLPRVFDLFVQERQALDRAQGGLGLGLAIVRSLVELHGGTVEAHSEGLGQGQRVHRPAARRAGAGERRAGGAPPAAGSGRARRRTRSASSSSTTTPTRPSCWPRALRLMGHIAARRARRPGRACASRRTSSRDVALLDIGLPVMDGYELARHLRGLPGLRRGPARRGHRLRPGSGPPPAAEAGFDDHLVKPIDFGQLQETLARTGVRSG